MEFAVIALALMAAFTGVALYVHLVEHPARRALLDGEMLARWQAVQPRAGRMRTILVLAGAAFGLLAAVWAARALYLTGALLALAVWAVGLRVTGPVERELAGARPETADAATRALLEKWNLLEAMRTGLGFLAVCCFFAALP